MTDTTRPYTDDDLRAENARLKAALTTDPDYTGIGESMEDRLAESTIVQPDHDDTGSTWGELLDKDQFATAQKQIHDLITDAADTSAWAINLGAHGLQPDEHRLTWHAGDTPIARAHFAFHPDMSSEARVELVQQLNNACSRILADAAHGPTGDDTPAEVTAR